jgi:hypothetical protein
VGPGDAVAIASSDFTGGNLTIPDDAYVVVWSGKRVPGLFARGPTAGLTNAAVLGAVRSAAAHGHRPLLVGPMFEPPTTEFSDEFLGRPPASGSGSPDPARHTQPGYGLGGSEEGRRHHAWTEPTTDAQVHEHIAQFDDVIALKRERHETIPQEWLDRRAALAARLSGASLPRGIASALVFGHPQATTVHPETYGHLVPIVATSVDSIERRLQETQEHFARLSQLIAKVQDTAKNGKGAAKKRAQQELKSHNFAEAQVVRDLLHTETRTELNRLLRALSADRAVRTNPMRWRANHHGGWHAPGDPLGYGPRANRTRRARKTRKARKPSR